MVAGAAVNPFILAALAAGAGVGIDPWQPRRSLGDGPTPEPPPSDRDRYKIERDARKRERRRAKWARIHAATTKRKTP